MYVFSTSVHMYATNGYKYIGNMALLKGKFVLGIRALYAALHLLVQ